jgi:hypothetical protein
VSEEAALSVVIAYKGADPVDMKVYQEAFLSGFGIVFAVFSSERVNEVGVRFFTEFGQIKAFSFITGALFDEHIGSVRIGLEIFVSETRSHDKGDCVFVGDVRPGIDGDIDLSGRV